MQSKYYVFTSFQELPPQWDEKTMDYLVYQQEEAPDTKKKHWQGYVELKERTRMKKAQALLKSPNAHMEMRKGNALQAAEYAQKEDTRIDGPYEFGQPPRGKKKNNMEEIAKMISAGKQESDIFEHYPAEYIRYHRGIARSIHMVSAPREKVFKKLHVKVYYGKAGTGKTRRATDELLAKYGDFYMKSYERGTNWWDGYTNQKGIIIDDFEGEASINELLKVLDGWNHIRPLPIKGGFIFTYIETVIITSNNHPDSWYPWGMMPNKQDALMRRIDVLEEITEYTPPTQVFEHVEREPDAGPSCVWLEGMPTGADGLWRMMEEEAKD